MNKEKIDKLPPDVKKEFMKLAIKLGEKKKQTKIQKNTEGAQFIMILSSTRMVGG